MRTRVQDIYLVDLVRQPEASSRDVDYILTIDKIHQKSTIGDLGDTSLFSESEPDAHFYAEIAASGLRACAQLRLRHIYFVAL